MLDEMTQQKASKKEKQLLLFVYIYTGNLSLTHFHLLQIDKTILAPTQAAPLIESALLSQSFKHKLLISEECTTYIRELREVTLQYSIGTDILRWTTTVTGRSKCFESEGKKSCYLCFIKGQKYTNSTIILKCIMLTYICNNLQLVYSF